MSSDAMLPTVAMAAAPNGYLDTRDLFRAASVDEPRPDWTWNDMVEKAIALTRDENGDGNVDQYGLASSRRSSPSHPWSGRTGASSSTT
jgi:ABC-type glycerol-3-phosphate transport system substrate-binding protein